MIRGKKTMQNDRKLIIHNPNNEINIKQDRPCSIIDIYITKKDIYRELLEEDNNYNVKIACDLQRFFDTIKEPSDKKTYREKVNYYYKEWILYERNNRKTKEQQQLEINILEKLVQATISRSIVWIEKSSSVMDGIKKQRMATEFLGVTFYIVVVSYRNGEGKLKANIELQQESAGRKIETCPNKYNVILYNAIRKNGIKKRTEMNSHSVVRRTGGVKKEVNINHGDFVVRTNLFRCYYKDHLVEEVIGILKIITPQGREIQEKIPCAYCSECNCFYMLSSEYLRVSEKGILLCQLLDKSEYYKNGIPSKISVSSESLLMRHGYNVKASIGLTHIQRQIILRNIMESQILTPH